MCCCPWEKSEGKNFLLLFVRGGSVLSDYRTSNICTTKGTHEFRNS